MTTFGHERLAEFFTSLWDDWCETGGNLDGADLQELMEAHGIAVQVDYDPKKHTNMDGAEDGDTVLELTPGIQAAVDVVRANRRKTA